MIETATLTWFMGNYGSILQAYALQNTIMSLGYNNRIINYVPDKRDKISFFLSSSARMVTFKSKLESRKINADLLTPEEIREKEHKFELFYKNHLQLTELISRQKNIKQIADKYSVFVCGSDQIWNPGYFKACYFLDFVPDDVKKIAYAPSIGTASLSERERKRIAPLIDRINHISVREKTSEKIIKDMVKTNLKVVCDPVFTLTKQQWIEKLNLSIQDEQKYILCYFLGENNDYSLAVKKLAEKYDLKVKVIPTNSWGYKLGYETVKTVGPQDWLNLIYGAELVLTDSFHATAFSLIFNKNFYTLKRFSDKSKKSQNSRIYSILEIAGLLDRVLNIDSVDSTQYIIEDNDWIKANTKIQEYREDSILWFSNALES